LTAEGVSPIEIHCRLQVVYDECVDVRTVCRSANKCKNGKPGRADLCDKQQSEQPATVTDEFQEIKGALSAVKIMAIEWSSVERCHMTWLIQKKFKSAL
jgi:hypothetical protein